MSARHFSGRAGATGLKGYPAECDYTLVKTLDLYPDVAPFLRATLALWRLKKGFLWVLKDEILRYAQNDKGEQGAVRVAVKQGRLVFR